MMIMIGAGLCALLTAALAMPTNPDVQAPIEALGGSYMVGARYLALALAGTVIAVHAIANCAKKASPTASILEEVVRSVIYHAHAPHSLPPPLPPSLTPCDTAACSQPHDPSPAPAAASIMTSLQEPETFLHNGVSTHGLQRSPMKLNSDGTGIRMASMRR